MSNKFYLLQGGWVSGIGRSSFPWRCIAVHDVKNSLEKETNKRHKRISQSVIKQFNWAHLELEMKELAWSVVRNLDLENLKVSSTKKDATGSDLQARLLSTEIILSHHHANKIRKCILSYVASKQRSKQIRIKCIDEANTKMK